jgi:diguanylate cyclase (GGDEF)-like protein/PAS domain S-box-containing protein
MLTRPAAVAEAPPDLPSVPVALVVDDDADMRFLLDTILTAAGWEVQVVATAAQALVTCPELQPDVVLLDLNLRGASGRDVLAQLKADPRTRNIPVVFVTAQACGDDVVAGLDAGATDYLTKPFDPAQLVARATAALRSRRDYLRLEAALLEATDARQAAEAAEHEQHRTESRYQSLVEHLPDSIVTVYDLQLRVRWADLDGLARLGIRGHGWIGSSVWELLSPSELMTIHPLLIDALSGVPGTLEYFSTALRCQTLIDVIPVTDTAGEVCEVLTLARDVSSLRQGERAQRAAEQRYRTAFEAAPVGMAQVGRDGRFLKVNEALCHLLGRTPAELESSTVLAVIHPEDAESAASVLAGLVSGHMGGHRSEHRYIHADGSPVWVSVSAVAVPSDDGSPSHFLCHYLDITDQRLFESQLRYLADHDPITGLFNRRSFAAAMEAHVESLRRDGPRGALLILDLDHFKSLNDRLGHHTGDEAIAATAVVLRRCAGPGATSARLGGDEFAVLLPDADLRAADHTAAAIVAAVRAEVALSATDGQPNMTASIGVALFGAGATAEQVMIDADLAMYEAKERGRDRHRVHCPMRTLSA